MTWRERAACLNTGIDWFPAPNEREAVEACRAICSACIVRGPCLESALAIAPTNDPIGVFGGTTPDERRAIRRQRKETAA